MNDEEDGMVCSYTYYVSSLKEVIARVLKYYLTAAVTTWTLSKRNAFNADVLYVNVRYAKKER